MCVRAIIWLCGDSYAADAERDELAQAAGAPAHDKSQREAHQCDDSNGELRGVEVASHKRELSLPWCVANSRILSLAIGEGFRFQHDRSEWHPRSHVWRGGTLSRQLHTH